MHPICMRNVLELHPRRDSHILFVESRLDWRRSVFVDVRTTLSDTNCARKGEEKRVMFRRTLLCFCGRQLRHEQMSKDFENIRSQMHACTCRPLYLYVRT